MANSEDILCLISTEQVSKAYKRTLADT